MISWKMHKYKPVIDQVYVIWLSHAKRASSTWCPGIHLIIFFRDYTTAPQKEFVIKIYENEMRLIICSAYNIVG